MQFHGVKFRYSPVAFLLNLCVAVVHAQNTPPPGESERQLERDQERRAARDQALDTSVDIRLNRLKQPSDEVYISEQEEPCFKISQIDLIGEESKRFQWLLKDLKIFSIDQAGIKKKQPLVAPCLGTEGINAVMRNMQNNLISKGYVTSRIVTGSQNLKSGVLSLTLIPGRIANISFSDGKRRNNVLTMKAGDLLNLRDIEQTLESIKRLPSVETDIEILPVDTGKPGESQLQIAWQQSGKKTRYVPNFDNSGSQTTGEFQGGLSIAYDNLFGLHDITRISINQDVGGARPLDGSSESYGLSYSMPYGYWNLGLNVNKSEYFQNIQGAFESYRYSGDSLNVNLKTSRTILRDNIRKMDFTFNTWFRSSKNYINDAEVLPQRRKTAGVELTLAYKQFIKSAILNTALTYRKGLDIFGALPAPEEEFGEGDSNPSILKGDIHFQTPFKIGGSQFNYAGSIRVQYNLDRLIVQDRFSIGSRYTVRGYDGEKTLVGEKGLAFRNDFAKRLGNSNHSAYFALDYGYITDAPEQIIVNNEVQD